MSSWVRTFARTDWQGAARPLQLTIRKLARDVLARIFRSSKRGGNHMDVFFLPPVHLVGDYSPTRLAGALAARVAHELFGNSGG